MNEHAAAGQNDAATTAALGEQPLQIADHLPDFLLPVWELIQQYPLLGGLSLVIAFYLLALLTRVVFAQMFDRIAARSSNRLDNTISQLLRRPVFTTTFLLGLLLAVQISNISIGRAFLINLLASIIVISWMLFALRLSSTLLGLLSQNPRFTLVESRTIPMFDLITKLVVLLVASYVLLLIWGINPLGWLASAGIVGIAVGFAAKDTLANLFSGLFILADSPYKIGDYINLDSGERGMVTAIGMRSTRLLTREDVEITVPNAVIANAKITNESGGPTERMRVRIPVGVAYGSDADQVCEVLQNIGETYELACSDPAPRVRMRAFGASSLDFELLIWINQPADRGRVIHELLLQIYRTFIAEGIEIPYSKHDLYIKEMPAP